MPAYLGWPVPDTTLLSPCIACKHQHGSTLHSLQASSCVDPAQLASLATVHSSRELLACLICILNLQSLLDDFVQHNVDTACALLETSGRFLYRLPETHTRMANMAEVRHLTQVHFCLCLSYLRSENLGCTNSLLCMQSPYAGSCHALKYCCIGLMSFFVTFNLSFNVLSFTCIGHDEAEKCAQPRCSPNHASG